MWKQDSGIIVERSVGVEVSDGRDIDLEKSAMEKSGGRRGSGVRDISRGKSSTTPPIEEEEDEENGRSRGRKMRSDFEVV